MIFINEKCRINVLKRDEGTDFLELLKSRILHEGRIEGTDVVKVDSFLNHQMDVGLLNEIGKEFKSRFLDQPVTKILTIEASGIGIACITAQYFHVPVVFAKKAESRNLDREVYESKVFSYTKGKEYIIKVSKRYLGPEDHVLIIDDFLANGQAISGLKDIVTQAGAHLVGVGIVIEKSFQNGGKAIREAGIQLESLAIIKSIENNKIIFKEVGRENNEKIIKD